MGGFFTAEGQWSTDGFVFNSVLNYVFLWVIRTRQNKTMGVGRLIIPSTSSPCLRRMPLNCALLYAISFIQRLSEMTEGRRQLALSDSPLATAPRMAV